MLFCRSHYRQINSLALGRSSGDFENVIFNLALLIDIFKSSYANVLRWMPQNLTDDKSTLVQVMAWCRQAASHYLNQCWPRYSTPYGVTRPQWVNRPIILNQWPFYCFLSKNNFISKTVYLIRYHFHEIGTNACLRPLSFNRSRKSGTHAE